MTTIILHIQLLLNTKEQINLLKSNALAMLPCIENAFLIIEDGTIIAYGHVYELELFVPNFPKNIIDAIGHFVVPGWCDSHTHLVFTGSRENELVYKIKGLSYAEIAAKGVGIVNSAQQLQDISEDALFVQLWQRLQEVSQLGTVAIEIKSGYGLTVQTELKMLRVTKRLKEK